MSDHADTIRRALSGSPYGHEPRPDALAALDALLAERQQAQEDLDRTTTAANRIEQQLVEAASVVTQLRAERQQAIDERERNAHKVAAYDAARAKVKIEGHTRSFYVLQAEHAQARCEQAIDALRRFIDWSMYVAAPEDDLIHDLVEEAMRLVKLGEQP